MRIPIVTGGEPLIFSFKLAGNCPNCRIRVYDANRPNTDFTNRLGVLAGEQTFHVRMPIVGQKIIADIYQEGTNPEAENPNIVLIEKNLNDIEVFPQVYNSGDPLIKEMMTFFEEFAMRKNYLSAGPGGSVYLSDGGRFRIDYLDDITDRQQRLPNPADPTKPIPNPNYGRVLGTPARISQDRGVIEVSKRYFSTIPVTQAVPILAHEGSHFYLSENRDDEKEADENAKNISLGRGYSDGDVYAAFVNVFQNANTRK